MSTNVKKRDSKTLESGNLFDMMEDNTLQSEPKTTNTAIFNHHE